MYIYSNKDIYKGDWKMNIRHGVGTYFFAASLSQVPKLFHLKCFTLLTAILIWKCEALDVWLLIKNGSWGFIWILIIHKWLN